MTTILQASKLLSNKKMVRTVIPGILVKRKLAKGCIPVLSVGSKQYFTEMRVEQKKMHKRGGHTYLIVDTWEC